MDIAELLAMAKRPEDQIPLCLRGDLVVQFRRLEIALQDAPREAPSLGELSPAAIIANHMQDLRAQMQAAEAPFHLRALAGREWSDFRATQPDLKGDDPEADSAAWFSWVCQLVSRTVIDPVMTPEQVAELCDAMSGEQWIELSDGCWRLNAGKVSIPFSVAASVLTESGEPKSTQPAPLESPSPAGSEPNPDASPSTPTATTAG